MCLFFALKNPCVVVHALLPITVPCENPSEVVPISLGLLHCIWLLTLGGMSVTTARHSILTNIIGSKKSCFHFCFSSPQHASKFSINYWVNWQPKSNLIWPRCRTWLLEHEENPKRKKCLEHRFYFTEVYKWTPPFLFLPCPKNIYWSPIFMKTK